MNRDIRFYVIVTLLFTVFSCSEEDWDYNFRFDSLNFESDYLIIIGDTQYYYGENRRYLQAAIDWIHEAKIRGYRIQGILHPGDITDDNSIVQWNQFREIIQKVNKNCFMAFCTGNHDYEYEEKNGIYAISNRLSTRFQHFIRYEPDELITTFNGDITNSLLTTTILDEDYYVLALEFGPRAEVISWANELIVRNRTRKFIILTHAYLSINDIRYSYADFNTNQTWSPSSYFFSDNVSDAEVIWEELIKNNDNVKMVVCGHNSFSGLLVSVNSYGNDIIQIRFDPTNKPNGGDGWLQIIEFKNEENEGERDLTFIKGIIYNPIYNSFDSLSAGHFFLKY